MDDRTKTDEKAVHFRLCWSTFVYKNVPVAFYKMSPNIMDKRQKRLQMRRLLAVQT